jgi:hypothetical protein
MYFILADNFREYLSNLSSTHSANHTHHHFAPFANWSSYAFAASTKDAGLK